MGNQNDFDWITWVRWNWSSSCPQYCNKPLRNSCHRIRYQFSRCWYCSERNRGHFRI